MRTHKVFGRHIHSSAPAKCHHQHICISHKNYRSLLRVLRIKSRNFWGLYGVSQDQGYFFGGPHNKDYSILASILGVPLFLANYYIGNPFKV